MCVCVCVWLWVTTVGAVTCVGCCERGCDVGGGECRRDSVERERWGVCGGVWRRVTHYVCSACATHLRGRFHTNARNRSGCMRAVAATQHTAVGYCDVYSGCRSHKNTPKKSPHRCLTTTTTHTNTHTTLSQHNARAQLTCTAHTATSTATHKQHAHL